MLSYLPCKVFSGPLDEDVDIQFHASYVNIDVFYGTGRIEFDKNMAMDFKDSILQLAERVKSLKESIQTEEATKQIESLRAEIKTIMEDKDINKIYIDPVTNNVHEAAATVCELQNKLSEYYYVTQKGNKKIEKVYGDALLSYGNYVSNMKRDIWADRFIDRYIKTTDTADEVPYIWVCDSDFTYEGSKTSVSWVCYDKSDTNKRNILSVVYADYDATTGIFTNVFQVMDKHASESLNRA